MSSSGSVVTADGQFLVANETSNPYLFWALRGGGPGTYGVVTSLTYRPFMSFCLPWSTLGPWSCTPSSRTGVSLDVSKFGSAETTSVVPAWRTMLIHAVLNLPWADNVAQVNKMTEQAMPIIEAATPGSGAYVNEADFQQPDFQDVFWGDNYERLLEIKAKYDPENFFYTRIAPGSEAWTVANDGRMCRST
ncbi:hypothetical protein LQW54_001116 [Pestalotiopsis sp. IQ-011]